MGVFCCVAGGATGRQVRGLLFVAGVGVVVGRGVRSSDPSRSWLWLLWLIFPVLAAVLGAVVPVLADAGGVWIVVGAVVGVVVGIGVDLTGPVREWVQGRADDDRVQRLAGVSLVPIRDRDLVSLRVHASGRDAAQFAARDVVPQVRNLLAEGRPVLVEGPSMAGKTRLVVQVLMEGWADAPSWFPASDDAITRLVESGQDPAAGTVIFLDDVDRFVANGSLTLTLVDRWIQAGCVVVATITSSQYTRLSAGTLDKQHGWDVINRFTKVHLDPTPTAGELAAMQTSPYEDLAASAAQFGLPAILGGAPPARDKFQQVAEERSWGWALVRAAADWRRAGLGPATTTQLQTITDAYPDKPVTAPDWEQAWQWATDPFNHTVALINPVGEGVWEVLDLIADDATWPLRIPVLEAMATTGLTPQQSFALAVTGYRAAGDRSAGWIEDLLDHAITAEDSTVSAVAKTFREV